MSGEFQSGIPRDSIDEAFEALLRKEEEIAESAVQDFSETENDGEPGPIFTEYELYLAHVRHVSLGSAMKYIVKLIEVKSGTHDNLEAEVCRVYGIGAKRATNRWERDATTDLDEAERQAKYEQAMYYLELWGRIATAGMSLSDEDKEIVQGFGESATYKVLQAFRENGLEG